MNREQMVAALVIGFGILVLVAAALLVIVQGAGEQELARRVRGLRDGSTVSRSKGTSLLSLPVSLVRHVGTFTRSRVLSAQDAEALAKTLAAAGLDPVKAAPIFVGAKAGGLFIIPSLTFLATVFLGYASSKQALYVGLSLLVALLLPNFVISVVRKRFQASLRRGIPDALDLLVVCSEAGLGLDSAVERVAHEMRPSNRPVSIELTTLVNEMRVLPDRRIALANLAERTGLPALKRLAGTISQTFKYGTPLSKGMRSLAAEMRTERMTQFEERAGRLPALLVLPMILFILPCLFIVLMGEPVSKLIASFAKMHH